MKRKLCGDCGQPSLENETSCWACGSTQFAGSDQTIVGDRTIYIGQAAEKTTSWTVAARRQPWAAIAGVLAAGAFALFMCMVGYWLGRATAPDSRVAREEVPQIHPVQLPTPPTGLMVPTAGLSAGVPAQAAVADPPVVSIHSRPGAPPASPASATIKPVKDPLGDAPVPMVYQNPRLNRGTTAGVVSRVPVASATGGGTVPGATVVAIPSPPRNGATVMIRNSAAVQLEVALDGSTSQTAVIAAGGMAILNLSSGSYQLRASGGGISSPAATLAVGSGRTYSLTVNRHQDGDRESLSVTEPAVDGVGG
jgi:hypothetical protein